MPFDASVRAYLRAYQNEYRAALHGGQHTAELSFRVPMHEMFRRIAHDLNPAGTFDIILEPRNQGRMGRPDWRIQDRISLGVYGYIEAKGPSNEPFDTTPYRDQINRYLTLGHKLIITDGIDFVFCFTETPVVVSIIDKARMDALDWSRLPVDPLFRFYMEQFFSNPAPQRVDEEKLVELVAIRTRNLADEIRGYSDLTIEEAMNEDEHHNPNIATRLANAKIQEDRLAVLHRFEEMLQDNTLAENNWQDFFEENTWIFGYGLRYQILRVIQPQPNYGGVAVDGRGGQRGDFLTATEAETRFTCLVEIKKTTTPLLQREQYRNGVWGASNELTGAVSQIQVNCAQWETDARTERNREQLPRIYTVSPKGIVVIGKTSELNNWDKRNSFERFRQELRCPEVLTYDELYERAKFIAEGPAPLDEDTDFDMPF